jgi:hypothetical protein
MAKKASRVARKSTLLRQNVSDFYIELLREFAPRSAERLLNSGIELMEAHRELITERIQRLETAKTKISSGRQTARRRIAVRKRRGTRAKASA